MNNFKNKIIKKENDKCLLEINRFFKDIKYQKIIDDLIKTDLEDPSH